MRLLDSHCHPEYALKAGRLAAWVEECRAAGVEGVVAIGTDLKDAVHTVKIEIHPEQPDKAQILAKNGNKIDKPERFDATAFYPGAILLVGDVVR